VDQVIRDGVDRLKLLPGVELASAACCVPLEGSFGLGFKIVGRPLEQGPWHGGGSWMTASPGYFEVFKIPVIRGRTFTETDTRSAPAVVIINESMAKEYWKRRSHRRASHHCARGHERVRDGARPTDRRAAADSRDNGLNQDPGPKMFVPQLQIPDAVNALKAGSHQWRGSFDEGTTARRAERCKSSCTSHRPSCLNIRSMRRSSPIDVARTI
jgi:hypothetical protein